MADKKKLPITDPNTFVQDNSPTAAATRNATANYLYSESQRPVGPNFTAPPANPANVPPVRGIPRESVGPVVRNENLPTGVSKVNITPTRGYDTAIKRPAAGATSEFDPTKELYDRAQELLRQGSYEGDGGYRDRIKAVMNRKQGRRLLDAAKGFQSEAGMNTRANQQEAGALQRSQMQEEGQDRRSTANNANELLRTELTGRSQLANTQLSNQLSRDSKREEILLNELSPSKQAEIGYKGALTTGAQTANALAAQKQQLGDVLLNSPAGSPEYEGALRRLTALQGRDDPNQRALNEFRVKAATDPAVGLSPEQRAAFIEQLNRGGGATGYAEGGAVMQPMPMQGQGAMGMPDITPQINLVNDYRAYASAATRLGATPVSFDQFSMMKTQAAPAVSGYAAGGMVEEPSLFGFVKYALNGGRLPGEVDQQQQQSQQQAPQLNEPFAVANGISAIQNRKRQLDEAMNYAEGGAISVGGRQVLGAGDGKSDSLPAIIDGKKPAALSTGEFVFPVEAVMHFGMDKLNKMVEAARASSSK